MAEGKKVKARVLVDCAFGKCNTVVQVDEADVKSSPGLLDATAAAVAAGEDSDEHKAVIEAAKKARK